MDQELMNNISKIYSYLNVTELTDEMIDDINKYMIDYHKTLNAYINSDVKDGYITNRLQLLSGPINYILKNFNNDEYPTVKMIKESLNDDSMSKDNSFTRTLRNPNAVTYNDGDNFLMNGFTLSTVIISITVILGIILAVVALIIK